MKTGPLTSKHREVLAAIGLADLPANTCRRCRFEPGETVIKTGDELHSILIAAAGQAKVNLTAPSGKTIIVSWTVSQGVLGDVELLTDTTIASSDVTAMTPFDCVAVDWTTARDMLGTSIQFSNYLGRELAGKMLRDADLLAASAFQSARQRLCEYLLHYAVNDLFTEPLTETAQALNMSYRHLLRLMAELQKEGIIEKRTTGCYIADRDRLKETP